MRKVNPLRWLAVAGVCMVVLCGCEKKPEINYNALDQSGMHTATVDELKKQKITDQEISQMTKLKAAGASDDLCLSLFKAARGHGHDFTSGDAAVNLSKAGYSDEQILGMAQSDKIDILSGEAITLKLIGLSNPTVQEIINRRIQELPTLTSEQIGRLKNTGMSERQILDLIAQGLSDEQAEAQITKREATRNHSNTDFVRNRGRRSR
jgi:ATP/maltotriose-dependent transcriptional regulator MalT